MRTMGGPRSSLRPRREGDSGRRAASTAARAPGRRRRRRAAGPIPAPALPRPAGLPLSLLLAIALFLPASAAGLSAQEVRGTVVEAGSGRAVEGAFVRLLGPDGFEPAASALTAGEGGFLLRAPEAGVYRLRVERIGYESWTSEPVAVRAPGFVSRRIDLPVVPIALPDMTVGIAHECRTRPRGAAARWLRTAWEEARKALEVTRWVEDRGEARFRLRLRDRRLDARGRLLWEDSEEFEKAGATSFGSPPAEELAAGGFAREGAHGGWRLYGPSAAVLLSEDFLAGHCFTAAPGSGEGEEAGLFGLRFEPLEEREEVADIEGTLWLDRASGELRSLDFTYTGLDRSLARHGPGGRIEFARLAGGVWFVRRWSLRVPAAAETAGRERTPWRPRRRPEPVYREAAGEVLAVYPPGADSAVVLEP